MDRHIVIGTAGHVDHGKTTLVKALTGIDTDRTAEEKRRGLTIDLGFAWFDLPDGTRTGIVDVPGHEKFIKNIVAGLPGLNMVLLVVDAKEGVMPQTREHLGILTLFGVRNFIVVVTKADTVPPSMLDASLTRIKTDFVGTAVEDAPLIVTDALSGRGLRELVRTMSQMAEKMLPGPADGHGRLHVDRSFSLSGVGTIVTGTLLDGPMEKGQTLWLYPGRRQVRIRNIQVYEKDVLRAEPSQRTALNLLGISARDIPRGSVLCTTPDMTATSLIDVKVTVLSDAPPLFLWQRVRLLIGTREVMARIVPLGVEQIEPGEAGFLQIRVEGTDIYAKSGEPFILRSFSPMHTLAGGKILDAHPAKHRRFKEDLLAALRTRDAGLIEEMAAHFLQCCESPFSTEEAVAEGLDLPVSQVQDALQHLQERGLIQVFPLGYLHREAFKSWQSRTLSVLQEYHKKWPLRLGMPQPEWRQQMCLGEKEGKALLQLLLSRKVCRLSRRFIAAKGFRRVFSPIQRQYQSEIEKRLAKSGYRPVAVAEFISLGPDIAPVLDALQGKSLLFLSSEFVIFKPCLHQAADRIIRYFKSHEILTIRTFRDLLMINRQEALLLLKYFDDCGLTVRDGEGRAVGPKAADYESKGGPPYE